MSAPRAGDRIISEANAIVLAAARRINEAVRDLYRAGNMLQRHPDFVFVRGGGRGDPMPPADKVNLVTYRYTSIVSVLRDVELGDAARTLALDVRNDANSMASYIQEWEEGRRRRAGKLAKAA